MLGSSLTALGLAACEGAFRFKSSLCSFRDIPSALGAFAPFSRPVTFACLDLISFLGVTQSKAQQDLLFPLIDKEIQ